MAAKSCISKTKEELQEAIRKQGELVSDLKLQEQTDEVKGQVSFKSSYEFQPYDICGSSCVVMPWAWSCWYINCIFLLY